MSAKKGDDATSTDPWTRKLTRSDDWRMTSALGMSEYFSGEVALQVGPACPSDLVPSMESTKSGSACGGVQVPLGDVAR
jgi:hypothetical protein